MNEMTITTSATMTSREIADLVGSRPDSVKRTIERLATTKVNHETGAVTPAVIELPPTVEVKNHLGQTVAEYIFSGDKGKRDSIVVVAQLSPEFTARLVDRWQELEAQQQPAIPRTFADALRLAADQQEQIAQLAHENQQQADRIDTLESLLARGMSAPEFCRHLNGVNTMAINKHLLAAGWLYEDGGQYANWRVASYARDRYMTERPFEVAGSKGPFTVSKPILLAKGARWLLSKYMAGQLPMKRGWDGKRKHDLQGVLGVAV